MSTDVVCISSIQAPVEIEQGRLKTELQNLRRRGARNAAGEELSQGRCCARCKAQLGRIYNTGASCPRCRHRVCRQCREYRGSNGTDWLCLVCHKIAEIKSVSGEWMNEPSTGSVKRGGRRKILASPADILKRSIRRSWTINGPPASWCAVRGSPEFRAYQSLPRHQDYFEIPRTSLVIPNSGKSSREEEEEDDVFEESTTPVKDGEELNGEEREGQKPRENLRLFSTPNDEAYSSSSSSNLQLVGNETSSGTPGRISQIKPPRILAKLNFSPEVKQPSTKSAERKSNIPIFRRSSKEFEDIRSPIESAKRSLIPQRYRGSTDDLRRSREDITSPSQIPKLFSPRFGGKQQDERLKRQDSKDEIRCGLKFPVTRKEDRKDPREIPSPSKTPLVGKGKEDDSSSASRGETRSGIKVFCRRGAGESIFETCRVKPVQSKEQEKITEDFNNDETTGSRSIGSMKEGGLGEKEAEVPDRGDETGVKNDPKDSENPDVVEELPRGVEAREMLEKREPPSNSDETIKSERKFEGFKVWEKAKKRDNDNEKDSIPVRKAEKEMENGGLDEHADPSASENDGHDVTGDKDDLDKENTNNCGELNTTAGKEASEVVAESNSSKKSQEDYQVVTRRKFSKEEFSNPDDTDEVPNRRSSSHLSPEASPLSTRSSRYSPRESESEPTPALPRKTGESSASQRVRDAITRTRRESNSSARYESSGSESVRLSSGYVETRRVRFGGGSGIEEVQRDSATSAGEDEPRNSPHNPGGQRDSRPNPGALQGRAVRRRRQFDTQGSRRRGRSHARCCAEDFHHLHQVIGRGGQLSPPQGGPPGQDQPIIDYRRLVFISSDSSSGREEDDADSSSGSSSLNGAPRSSLTQGLEDCDWDYFESGGSVPAPLAHLQVGIVAATNSEGNSSNRTQDWSCCPGRGSSACLACGGARGANVFPVPVPIPVPVPYPVPVPASLWTSGLSSSSMINCTSAELGALQLSRGGGPSPLHPAAAQWFAWPPRFIHDVNAARSGDPVFAYQARDLAQINNLHASFAAAESGIASETKPEEAVKEEPKAPRANDQDAKANEEEEEPEEETSSSSSESEGELREKRTNSVGSGPQVKTSGKMYRLQSQGNSGSSSGRSSADSSDLEDSASHHFSRVFVVNDDSSTSDNDPEDVEDVEDSDSNREVGITLRRVTALPEEGPVVLRHVRFLDEDGTRNEGCGSEGDKEAQGPQGNDQTVRLKFLRNLDPEANEIYLVDSKDDSEHRIELKSVRSLDPDVPETADPDSLMPEAAEGPAIVPDSLEIEEAPSAGDTCDLYRPEANRCDKSDAREDKQLGLLSELVYDDTVFARPTSQVLTGSISAAMSETAKSALDQSQSLSTTGSSDTTTGSEVSSDELHEYEITAWTNESEENSVAFAINEGLVAASGFASDGFSTDEGSSSRLDSGVATGVEDTNPSGRTDDGSSASLETTPGESIELVHSAGGKAERGGESHSVNDLISIKIHEIFKSVERRGDKPGTRSSSGPEESVAKIERRDAGKKEPQRASGTEENGVSDGGERTASEQAGGEHERGIAATAQVSVERRPPAVKDGCCAAAVGPASHKQNSDRVKGQNIPGNRYKSLVMITQGAYQPVNVVTSDTTTLLQPDEGPPPPRGLAGYYHLALENAAESSLRNGNSGPRRPPTVKRAPQPPRVLNIEAEVDSGLSVGSASESDDVQSVKSASKVAAPGPADKNHSNESPGEGPPRNRPVEGASTSGVVLILEEGLADDDSWVEEVSHDEDEQGATTATEESSEDEANNLGDREEELRGYHRQAIDFTLHTIVEESCEESEAEPSMAVGSPRKQRPPSASELEKYFFFGLGEGAANVGGAREADSLSETSSIYSEGLESLGQDEPGQNADKNSPDYLSSSSSRLEKYFLSDFLGFDRDRRDSDGSVGSDSEGRPSPEQRRKRLVRARGTGRSHSSSLDNLLALTQSSANLSSQNSLQDLSLNPESQETQSEGSSTETDGADDQTPAFGTDGQFDTVKRKKKKPRNLGTQSPRTPDDRNKTPEPSMEADGDLLEAGNSEDDRAKTPQPDGAVFSTSSQSADANRKQTQASESTHPPGRSKQQSDSVRGVVNGLGNEVNLTRSKQHSRDSGFIGSCDDLLQHQRVSGPSDGQGSGGGPDQGKKDSHERRSNDAKWKEGGVRSSRVDQPVSQVNLAPPNASLSRKDSFNNWSSDEETNLMMSKMRQFFKTMVANSNNSQNSNNSSAASPAPSPRLSGSSPRSRIGAQNRTKPPQLVYFENELTRLMKTVPGIRDEQVKEIVEYLSSEDTWSDSYDSSDYTSSDLEGAGGRRSALQEQISQSCQQIISKFDTTGAETTLPGKEPAPSVPPGPTQPLSCRDTAFVYQKLVQSFTKMTGEGVSSDASSTPHSSPPLIAKVMHHIGSRLVALMHEVSEGGPAAQPSWRRYPHHRTPSSASTTEDDDSTSESANTPAQHQLPRSKSHDPLLLLNGYPAAYQEGEEREASDNERFSWRGSFESALMPADSRTKLSLLACSGDVSASASALAMAAKRRSAGDLLFNPKSLSREQLDRVRSCGSIGGGTGSIEDKIWSNRRRSSVPDANTRGESGASAGDDDTEDELEYGGDPRATTLPRGLQAAATATNSLPRLPAGSANSGPVTMHKVHSVHHFLQQHNNVKSARYRPPGFARNNINGGGTGGPKRAVSAPGLQLQGGSNSAGKRETARSRRQAVSLAPDDGSSLSEACSTPIIGGVRGGSLSNDDDMDRSLHTSLLGNRASSSSLGARSESMASVYSGAGEGRWCGSVAVRGEVEFALQYDYKLKTFEVRVTQCRDLAPVDVKRNRSDPYVKVYLLPDKSKGGKRKTKVKKHTLNPVFDETLKFHMSLNGLETRTLWLTVWHSDMFGRNDFLGEVRMALENKIFDDLTPRWYPLQERSEPFDDPITCKGEVIVGLKFVPPDPTQQQERLSDRTGSSERIGSKIRKSWSKGALHVLVKEARNLQTRAKHGGTCDPFCKSYLLPDKGRSGKQKTGVVRRCTGGSPVWGHTFVYKDVSLQELADRGLELTVWDHDRIASNEFLGGVRFNLGTGKHYGKSVEWMDATGRELSLWQNMLERPNFWVEGAVTLRPNLHNHTRNNST